MRVFALRIDDATGVSGTGVVADGIEFDDGVVVVHWRGEDPSTVVWPNVDSLLRVNGHDGKTVLVDLWDDQTGWTLATERGRRYDIG